MSTMSTVTVAQRLAHTGLCTHAWDWAQQYVDSQRAWNECRRGDWLLWVWARETPSANTLLGRRLVACACACACLTVPLLSSGDDILKVDLNLVADWAHASGVQDTTTAWMTSQSTWPSRLADQPAGAACVHAMRCILNLQGHAHKVATCVASACAGNRTGPAAVAGTTAHQAYYDALHTCAEIVRLYHPQAPTLVPVPDPICTFQHIG